MTVWKIAHGGKRGDIIQITAELIYTHIHMALVLYTCVHVAGETNSRLMHDYITERHGYVTEVHGYVTEMHMLWLKSPEGIE